MDFRFQASCIRTRGTPSRLVGFTLTEMLVVISLIVLLMAMALPAFRFLNGSRSVEGATNVISAALTQARADAIGVQKIRGVVIYREAVSQRVAIATVQQVAATEYGAAAEYSVGDWVRQGTSPNYVHYVCIQAGIGQPVSDVNYWKPVHADVNAAMNAGTFTILDIVPNRDRFLLTAGIDGRTASDSYAALGAILFDGYGSLTVQNVMVARESQLYQQVVPNVSGPPVSGLSQIGFMLFDEETFKNQNLAEPSPAATAWISNNATPLLVNRYNGTIVKGE